MIKETFLLKPVDVFVVPAKAGIPCHSMENHGIRAFAGTTRWEDFRFAQQSTSQKS
jgi:hypothetical protein